MKPEDKPSGQAKRFIETARQLECDEDKDRFEAKLRRIAGVRAGRVQEIAGMMHWSDCAVNRAPAYEPASCDCGGFKAENK